MTQKVGIIYRVRREELAGIPACHQQSAWKRTSSLHRMCPKYPVILVKKHVPMVLLQ